MRRAAKAQQAAVAVRSNGDRICDLAAVTFGRGELAGAIIRLPEPRPTAPIALPAAEREIAALLFEGLSLAAIARRRGRSRFTVMNQVRSLYRRLGVVSRVDLVRVLARGQDPDAAPARPGE